MRGLLGMFLAAAVALFSGCGTPTVDIAVATKTKASLVYTATVKPEALHSLPVMSQVSGPMLTLLPAVGTKVAAGDLLTEIDSTAYDAQIADIESRLQSLPQAASSAPVDDSSMEASLLRQGIITRAEYDRLRGKKSVGEVTAAGNEALEVALRAAQAAKDACRVTAPIDGIVAEVYETGNTVTAGRPILLLRQDTPVTAEIEVPVFLSEAVDRAKEERTLTVTISNSDKQQILYGELKKESEEISGPYCLYRIQVDNPDGAVSIGNPYQLRVDTGREADGILIPASAILGGDTVQIVTADGLIDMRRVVCGTETDGKRIVFSGIAEGERVVTKPDASLTVGTKVKVR